MDQNILVNHKTNKQVENQLHHYKANLNYVTYKGAIYQLPILESRLKEEVYFTVNYSYIK